MGKRSRRAELLIASANTRVERRDCFGITQRGAEKIPPAASIGVIIERSVVRGIVTVGGGRAAQDRSVGCGANCRGEWHRFGQMWDATDNGSNRPLVSQVFEDEGPR